MRKRYQSPFETGEKYHLEDGEVLEGGRKVQKGGSKRPAKRLKSNATYREKKAMKRGARNYRRVLVVTCKG